MVGYWLVAIFPPVVFPQVVELNLVKYCQRFGCLPWALEQMSDPSLVEESEVFGIKDDDDDNK